MQDNLPYAQIDMAKVPADRNSGGLIFTVATLVIFLLGIPILRYIFPIAIVLGCMIAVFLRVIHERN